ncbi:MAG: methionine--tRNA ligase, partial [Ruminococcaceae bacterium]|nr:methionine--tRNA ligase [Oscillospiraceae bacterium]
NPEFIMPESRRKEMVNNFIKPGLQDLCVSRSSFKWGVPVSFDENHVIYVWIDALSNYITALGYDVDGSGDLYKKYWPANVHIIGKDILRFHTIYWPIILMALGEPLPKQVFGHPWLLNGDSKMSKSLGNVIYADDLVRHFGVDAVRYYVLREMPYAQDGTITYETLISRFNADLANTLGNLVNRTVAMSKKYFDGKIENTSVCDEFDNDLIQTALDTKDSVIAKMNEFKVADSLEIIMNLARRLNKYIDETMPWALAKDEESLGRLKTVLYNLIEGIRFIGILLAPFMPETSQEILKQIGATYTEITSLDSFGKTESGTFVGDAKPLFQRIDEAKKLAEITNEVEETKKKAAKEVKKEEKVSEISIDDFAKVELKVGEVMDSKPVEGADKLLVSQIKIGNEVRQIVSGIAKYYNPSDLIGKKVVVVTNLKPVKLRGVLSEGMILAASDGKDLSLIAPDKDFESGSQVR